MPENHRKKTPLRRGAYVQLTNLRSSLSVKELGSRPFALHHPSSSRTLIRGASSGTGTVIRPSERTRDRYALRQALPSPSSFQDPASCNSSSFILSADLPSRNIRAECFSQDGFFQFSRTLLACGLYVLQEHAKCHHEFRRRHASLQLGFDSVVRS